MKKTLIALAALAAVGTASAQSTVTLSGILKGGVAQTKYSNGTAATPNNGSSLGLADGSSRFIMSGSEDLGGGLRANFQIDTRFRVEDNGSTTAPTAFAAVPSQLAGGVTFVGLSGAFGNVQLGKLDTHYCLGADSHGARATGLTSSSCAVLGYVPAPTGASSAIANTAIGQQTRSQNALRYTTPSISGFTALVTYSTSQGGSEGNMGDVGKGRLISGALNYAAGPIRAGLSVLDSTVENRTAGAAIASPGDQKAMSAVLGYDFGMGTVGLGLDRSTVTTGAVGGATTDTKRNSWSVPVTFKLGAGTLLATYSRANDTNLAADSGANMWSVGYEHPLSKRTTLGVSYVRLDNKSAGIYGLYTQASLIGGAGQTIGQDASQFYVGVRHTF